MNTFKELFIIYRADLVTLQSEFKDSSRSLVLFSLMDLDASLNCDVGQHIRELPRTLTDTAS